MSARADTRPADAADVLGRAVLRAAQALGLTQKHVAAVIGVSASSLSRLGGGRRIDPSTKEGELAVLFLRLFRSLDAIVGGNAEHARAWLHAENHHLGGVPAEQITSVEGLVHAVEYLDAMRGKV